MNKNKTLREALGSGSLLAAMAAHKPLAARLAEQAGFGALWGSGFELSASYAVPDANILSMGTPPEMMRAIASVPLIADIDTGFGNAINVSYIVPQYEAAGASAVIMEDKTFPPTAYPQLSEADIAALGKVALVIDGNHAIRAAAGAMRKVFEQIRRDGGIARVDATLPSVSEMIELQGDAEMRALEARFLR